MTVKRKWVEMVKGDGGKVMIQRVLTAEGLWAIHSCSLMMWVTEGRVLKTPSSRGCLELVLFLVVFGETSQREVKAPLLV